MMWKDSDFIAYDVAIFSRHLQRKADILNKLKNIFDISEGKHSRVRPCTTYVDVKGFV